MRGSVTAGQGHQYEKDGFIVLKAGVPGETIERIREQLGWVLRDQLEKRNGCAPADDCSLNELFRTAFVPITEQRSILYELIRHVPEIATFCSSHYLIELLRALGHEMPICMQFPTVRVDIPGETQHLIGAHQDLRSIVCHRCTTVWFPLVSVDETKGTVDVYPGSHKLGVIEHELNGRQLQIADTSVLGDRIVVEAEPGDLVVFDSFCAHGSIPGQTDQIKLNVQTFWNDAAAIDTESDLWALTEIPDSRDLPEPQTEEAGSG